MHSKMRIVSVLVAKRSRFRRYDGNMDWMDAMSWLNNCLRSMRQRVFKYSSLLRMRLKARLWCRIVDDLIKRVFIMIFQNMIRSIYKPMDAQKKVISWRGAENPRCSSDCYFARRYYGMIDSKVIASCNIIVNKSAQGPPEILNRFL